MNLICHHNMCLEITLLIHWGRVTHICIVKLTIIGSDNGLSPGRHQAITGTNVGILLIGPLGTNFREMLIKTHIFSFMKIHLKKSSGKWRPFCLSLNVLTITATSPRGQWIKFTNHHGFCERNYRLFSPSMKILVLPLSTCVEFRTQIMQHVYHFTTF